MAHPYKLGIMVGRFQTIHSGHELMINKAIELCDRVGLFVGSSQESRTEKNPFTYEERLDMLKTLFGDKVEIYPLPDIGVGNNTRWGAYVLENVRERFGTNPDLLISGKEARRIDWFDDDELNISELYIPKTIDISGTDMRNHFLADDVATWQAYTSPKLWPLYDKLREIVISSQGDSHTSSI